MELKITKGEWIVDNAGDVIIKGSDAGVSFPARDGTIASINDGEYIENINKHDAHLIAAAPLMYREIEEDIDFLECLIIDAETSGEKRSLQHKQNLKIGLLAKARGEQ